MHALGVFTGFSFFLIFPFAIFFPCWCLSVESSGFQEGLFAWLSFVFRYFCSSSCKTCCNNWGVWFFFWGLSLAPIVLLLLSVTLSGFLESPGDFYSPYVSPIFFRSYNTVLLSYVLIFSSFWICSLEVFFTKKYIIYFIGHCCISIRCHSFSIVGTLCLSCNAFANAHFWTLRLV